ncbi:putative toxin-antitoxin system toxin component, PIN family [Pseudothauera nasutitermitis]|uniref:Putative toxin-antitoxin system toxin component, PIN family n=1 Tax=Pseudothauera nasutitermitis TaxID=2565930 RepID=A0A4S4AZ46_9RHOO|nr:putative toxin-antitoxin system toxin component, PIN family [Pseudothauera nasutitermitis]THF65431.1 putative toxin-antitoxin system toxin component, PIN family [Pseudothauera nasutitermitis]
MKAKRAVVDSNVLISATLSPGSSPARIVFWLLEHGRLLFCEETFAELETRLWRPKFDRYLSLENRLLLLHDLSAVGEWIKLPPEGLRPLSRDADDDKFIWLAQAGGAEWLVSGDRDLLDLEPPEGLRILSPADALALIEAS